jgi:ligand-binding SRPBCC domain-containing protein
MRFVKESRIAVPPAVVFAFHETPGAFQALTPPWEKVEIVEGDHSIRPGSRVGLRTHVGLIPLKWVAEHTEYEPGRMFADRQVSGPFQSWYHRHFFLDDGTGGTIVRDEVDYEPPLGWLGRRLGSGFLEERLNRLFDFRHQTLKTIMESGAYVRPSADLQQIQQAVVEPSEGHRASSRN